jgi:eukaryotic-like serine/threonine-protein kinase
MQLLEGQTLCELISAAIPGKPPFTLTSLLNLAIQITEGLEAAHNRGIVHRDIKPANIFVTMQVQAKILDFGLAKLASLTRTSGSQSAQPNGNDDQAALQATGKTESSAATDISISLTGVAMGTAGYMSPEQVRGEQLDARTDLFSLGVVLYEMATGKRAFMGDTGPVLQNAILTKTPASVSKLNPEIPAKLERIVNKALEKDRAVRYQTTAELRADLESVKQAMQSRQNVVWLTLASGALIASVAMIIFWISRHKQTAVEPLPNPKLRQLTVNSFENSVMSGVISPDGKYLAYTNGKRIYIRVLETAETRSVPQPAEFNDKELQWEMDAAFWLPDSTKFIVDAHPSLERYGELSSKGASIWAASVSGEAPRKLRDEAFGYAISPDGSLIC